MIPASPAPSVSRLPAIISQRFWLLQVLSCLFLGYVGFVLDDDLTGWIWASLIILFLFLAAPTYFGMRLYDECWMLLNDTFRRPDGPWHWFISATVVICIESLLLWVMLTAAFRVVRRIRPKVRLVDI